MFEKIFIQKTILKKNRKLFFLRKKLCSASHTYNYAKKFFNNCDKEILIAITLDSQNYISSISIVSIGSINTLNTSPSEIFKTAIISNSSSIILVHNHPTGDPTPSNQDIKETLLFNKSSKILGINFLDHIIIGDNTFFSFKKHNII